MTRRIRAIEHRRCAAGLACAHSGLQDRFLLNYSGIENAHKVLRKTFVFLLCIKDVQQTFTVVFLFPCWNIIQLLECFYVNNCSFWVRATVLWCYRNWWCSQCGQRMRWSDIADKIKTIVFDKVNCRGTQT